MELEGTGHSQGLMVGGAYSWELRSSWMSNVPPHVLKNPWQCPWESLLSAHHVNSPIHCLFIQQQFSICLWLSLKIPNANQMKSCPQGSPSLMRNYEKSWGLRSHPGVHVWSMVLSLCYFGGSSRTLGRWLDLRILTHFFLRPIKHELSLFLYHMVLTMMCCQTTGPKQRHLATMVGNCYGYHPLSTWGLQSPGCGPLRVPVWDWIILLRFLEVERPAHCEWPWLGSAVDPKLHKREKGQLCMGTIILCFVIVAPMWYQLLLAPAALTFLPQWADPWAMSWSKPFPLELLSSDTLISATRRDTKTETMNLNKRLLLIS